MELGVTAVMLPELDFDQQLALCHELAIRYYQYRPRIIPPERRQEPHSNWGNHKFDLTPERLVREGRELTRRLRDAGLEPWGTLPNLTVDMPDDEMELHLEGAAGAEAKCVRCGLPRYPATPFDYAQFLERALERYAYIVEKLSGPMGIKLILETHAGTAVCSPGLAWNVVRHFPPEQVGVIFDLPNFAREGAVNPILAVSVLRDHIDCCHVGGSRRVVRDVDPLGCKVVAAQMCRMEESDLHLPTWLAALRDARLAPPLIIEDFTPNMAGADRLRQSAASLKKLLGAL